MRSHSADWGGSLMRSQRLRWRVNNNKSRGGGRHSAEFFLARGDSVVSFPGSCSGSEKMLEIKGAAWTAHFGGGSLRHTERDEIQLLILDAASSVSSLVWIPQRQLEKSPGWVVTEKLEFRASKPILTVRAAHKFHLSTPFNLDRSHVGI